jgi:hypothetical protein
VTPSATAPYAIATLPTRRRLSSEKNDMTRAILPVLPTARTTRERRATCDRG